MWSTSKIGCDRVSHKQDEMRFAVCQATAREVSCNQGSLIAVAKTSQTMLNNSGKNGHPCLIPHLEEMLSVSHC